MAFSSTSSTRLSSASSGKSRSPASNMSSSSSGKTNLLSNNFYISVEDDDIEEIQETETLRNIVSKAAKYGSMSSHATTSLFPHNQKFITHILQPQDTLQGLALKYSVTMEQIRRANRLYTSDSLFCKSVLSIPIPTDSSTNPSLDEDEIKVIVEGKDDLSPSFSQKRKNGNHRKEKMPYQNAMSRSQSDFSWSVISSSPDPISSDPSSISLSNLNGSCRLGNSSPRPSIRKVLKEELDTPTPEESADDFLSRIDSSIAQTKSQVAKNQLVTNVYSSSGLRSQESDLATTSKGKRSTRVKKQLSQPIRQEVSLDLGVNGHDNGSPNEVPACYIRTKDTKVRYSMRRLEKEQDELFQL